MRNSSYSEQFNQTETNVSPDCFYKQLKQFLFITVMVDFIGVGKTSLVHLICHNEPILNPYWTIGAGVEVKVRNLPALEINQNCYFPPWLFLKFTCPSKCSIVCI